MDEGVQTAGEQAKRTREQRRAAWKEWLEESERLNQLVLTETKGVPVDIELALRAARADLEARDARVCGGDE
ncbi:MAG: hypothetical protein F4X62_08580 [Caldilineaceae bacterium SB0662_bin_25]|nr:hypothetical protein [Caldilineaceae bacterium SB0662_bin_25]